MRLVLALFVALIFLGAGRADEPFALRDGQRIVFLGDSNTFAGRFLVQLDAYLFTRFPEKKFTLLNLGLPSETVSGLSEPDHPYPRPDVHERVERALAKSRPDVVVICYGMNDGIYYPPADERFKKYQAGIESVLGKVKKAGAKAVLMTPAPFDPLPLKDRVLPRTADRFSWMHPYSEYDQVLGRYSDWLLTLRAKGYPVADPHTAINRYLTMRRKTEPSYRVSGDGIHPDATGHWFIAQELLRTWQAPGAVDRAEIDGATGKMIHGDINDLHCDEKEIRFRWKTRLPMPSDPGWDRKLAGLERIHERWNRHLLMVKNAPRAKYELYEGDRKLGTVTRDELAAGVDLLAFPDLSTNQNAQRSWKLLEERQGVLGLAWLTDVGHKRPGTPKGIALDEATRRAEALEKEIRRLTQPVTLTLRLLPVP